MLGSFSFLALEKKNICIEKGWEVPACILCSLPGLPCILRQCVVGTVVGVLSPSPFMGGFVAPAVGRLLAPACHRQSYSELPKGHTLPQSGPHPVTDQWEFDVLAISAQLRQLCKGILDQSCPWGCHESDHDSISAESCFLFLPSSGVEP